MRNISFRSQQTLAKSAEVQGTGFLTGSDVRLCFRPAPPETGVVFVRTDLQGSRIPACLGAVTGTQRRTTLGRPPAHVGLVEHVLAALAGLHVDNCFVELDAPEPPGLDGSAQAFVCALRSAGVVRQPAQRKVWCVDRSFLARSIGATVAIHPVSPPSLVMSYFLDYGPAVSLPPQVRTLSITPASFVQQLAASRTFLLEREAHELRKQGIGPRTTTADLLVFGPRGPMDNRLRYADEPARHKILDMIGDLSLLGVDLCGHVVACRSGHPLNIELARRLEEALGMTTVPSRLAA